MVLTSLCVLPGVRVPQMEDCWPVRVFSSVGREEEVAICHLLLITGVVTKPKYS